VGFEMSPLEVSVVWIRGEPEPKILEGLPQLFERTKAVLADPDSDRFDCHIYFDTEARQRQIKEIVSPVIPALYVQRGTTGRWRMAVDGTPGFVLPQRAASRSGVGVAGVLAAIAQWIDKLTADKQARSPSRDVQRTIEEFIFAFDAVADRLLPALNPDDRRQIAAYRHAAGEVAKVEDPDPGVVRAMFSWFGRKLDLFIDEATKAAGKTVGVGMGIGVGLGVSEALHLRDLGAWVSIRQPVDPDARSESCSIQPGPPIVWCRRGHC
jgi:hypothetical protein